MRSFHHCLQRLALAVLAVLVVVVAGSRPAVAAGGRHPVPDLREGPRSQRHDGGSSTVRIRIPLSVHVATVGGHPIRSRADVEAWVVRANRALAPYGIETYLRRIHVLPGGYTDVTQWRDRRRLARRAPVDGSLHVFVVDTLELFSVRQADGPVRGLHWRYRGINRSLARREYVVVANSAPETTLTHEVGHVLGLRHHEGLRNLMCSCREGPNQRFTAGQGQVLRNGARDFFRRQSR